MVKLNLSEPLIHKDTKFNCSAHLSAAIRFED